MKTTVLVPALSAILFFFFISCQKEISFEKEIKAVYSFDGGTSSCTGATISGTFTEGTQATAENKVVLNVTVDSIGTYTISTDTVNGFSFNGTGVFSKTGEQTVTLTASGTPASAGDFTFTLGVDACNFDVTVDASSGGPGGPGGPGTGSGNYLKCKIDGVLSNFNTSLTGYYVSPPTSGIPYSISVQGKNSDVAGSNIELSIGLTNPTAPTTGSYTNRIFSTGMTDRSCIVTWFPAGFANPPIWSSSLLTANTFTVNISSISTSGAAGTFSGTISETTGSATKKITEGEFKISF